jgi:hypothetical protein
MGRMARIASTLTQKYHEEKARLKGEGISKARMVKQAKYIPEIATALTVNGPAKPIPGANVKMHDGDPLTFFTDGSLRSSFGAWPDVSPRQRRKAIKRARAGRRCRRMAKV